jgi:hypothetical protein
MLLKILVFVLQSRLTSVMLVPQQSSTRCFFQAIMIVLMHIRYSMQFH